MAKVRLSVSALKDLEAIWLYISTDSELYAERVVTRISERFKILETHIRIGKVVREFQNVSIREILEEPYRIIYRIDNEEMVSILRIYHNARVLKKL